MLKPIHVAVALVCRGDDVLIARRPAGRHQGGLLEFPGGKVEAGETVRDALVRELAEEVAISADPVRMRPLIQIRHDYGDKQVLLDVWKVPAFKGVPQGLEGQPVRWMARGDLQDEDFPAANRPIIRALRLPAEWLITGPCEDPRALAARLENALPRQSACGLVLRQPGLSRTAYLGLAEVTLDLCHTHGIAMMLHGDPGLLEALPAAAGVHLSQRAARDYTSRDRVTCDYSARDQGGVGPLGKGKWLGISCHSPEELAQAADAGADYAFLSPVLSTASHPGQPGLGWQRFATWVAGAVLPVYGLGGMRSTDIERSQQCGGQGVAGIGHWWNLPAV